jgi:hypothetical protein
MTLVGLTPRELPRVVSVCVPVCVIQHVLMRSAVGRVMVLLVLVEES